MKFFGRLLIGLLFLGNLLLMTALSVHVVSAPGKTAVIAKSHLSLVDTLVDTRQWTAADANDHAALVARIHQAGRDDLLPSFATASAAPSGPVITHESSRSHRDAGVTEEPRKKTIFDFDDKK